MLHIFAALNVRSWLFAEKALYTGARTCNAVHLSITARGTVSVGPLSRDDRFTSQMHQSSGWMAVPPWPVTVTIIRVIFDPQT